MGSAQLEVGVAINLRHGARDSMIFKGVRKTNEKGLLTLPSPADQPSTCLNPPS